MKKIIGVLLATLLGGVVSFGQANIAGTLYAANFSQWSMSPGDRGPFSWSDRSACVGKSGGVTFIALQVGSPVLIQDANPANTETVTPTAVNIGNSGCSFTATFTHTHTSFKIVSGTAGLQEAINYASGAPSSVVLVTPAWTLAGGLTAMLTAASGSTAVGIIDQRTATAIPYLWSGSAYVATPYAGGGGAVASFNGRSGVVVPATNDYAFSQISGTLNLATQVTGLLAVADGGTGTATPGIVAGTNITVTGTWPNQTVNSTASGGAVSSVFGRTGAVVATNGDYAFSNLSGNIAIAQINSGTGASSSTFLRGDNTWATPSGSGSPGGSSGQTQYNNAGSFGGYTMSGDGTIVASTGVITITKTNGVAFATSATTDTTNASNIASGTLAAARLPATAVQTNQANAYSAGVQNFSSAAGLTVPSWASAPITTGTIGFNTTVGEYEGYSGSAWFFPWVASGGGTAAQCAYWISAYNLGSQACGSGSGISGGTAGFLPLFGTSTTITGSSPLDYNITTAGFVSSSKPFEINDTTDPAFMGFVANGVAPAVQTSAAGWGLGATLTTAGYYKMPDAPGTGVWTAANASGIVTNTFTPIQGTDTNLLSSGTVSGTGAALCTDSSGGATTSGCSGGAGIANITVTLPTSSISGTTCTTPATATMTGLATTSVFATAFATNPNAVTGWGATGGLEFTAWPTSNTLNWSVCNVTSGSITPGAMTLNVGAR